MNICLFVEEHGWEDCKSFLKGLGTGGYTKEQLLTEVCVICNNCYNKYWKNR